MIMDDFKGNYVEECCLSDVKEEIKNLRILFKEKKHKEAIKKCDDISTTMLFLKKYMIYFYGTQVD